MWIVGITGVIGAGKSSVARALVDLGGHWLNADQMARQAIEPNTEGWQLVIDRFGHDLLQPGGQINRALLATRLGHDQERWQQLEQIIHPRVRQLQAIALFHLAQQDQQAVALLDIPLLFETGAEQLCDSTVAVLCGSSQQQRLQQRGGMMNPSQQAVQQAMMARQLSEQQKRQRADRVIDNSGPWADTQQQVATLWQQLTEEYATATDRVWPLLWSPFLPANLPTHHFFG
ncbi:MAG: dephospho-CoA kinase [Magnetococcales bacterium]|nr:dephospho-CoA kinase [Magnetococcales bacterium]